MQPSPSGLAFAPLVDNEPMSLKQVQQLSEEEREKLQASARDLEEEAQKIFQGAPRSKRQLQRQMKKLNWEVAEQAIKPLINEVRQQYESISEVGKYLDSVQRDLIERNEDLLKLHRAKQTSEKSQEQMGPQSMMEPALLRRYRVNVIVDYEQSQTAPVIYEDNPTYQNVVGRIEHMAQMGALTTDFNLIKPGALHRANGGYLILEGFFDTCQAQEFTGEQGVLIPAANRQHLMLRQDVIEAVKAERFHIYPVETIDQGIELLTGVPAGEPDQEGNYPAESVNGKVSSRLSAFAKKRRELLSATEGE